MKFTLLIVLFLFVQSDWVNQIETKVKKIDINATLTKTKEKETNKYGFSRAEVYESEQGMRINGHYSFGQTNINSSIYINNDLIIAEFASGVEPFTYQTQKNDSQPYGVLKEKQVYYKNQNEGVEKTRKIELFESDDITQKKKELSELVFEIRNITKKEYNLAQERFDIIIDNM